MPLFVFKNYLPKKLYFKEIDFQGLKLTLIKGILQLLRKEIINEITTQVENQKPKVPMPANQLMSLLMI